MPAPDPAALVAWPDSFGRRFTIFIDTEEEFDWNGPFVREGHGTSHMAAVPAAHGRFAAQGAALTYLVDYPIVAAPAAAEILRELLADGSTGIGTQLHSWVNPPFEEELNAFNSFAGNLAPALEEAKLLVLTDAIERATGVRPRAYRAGRYGLGPHTLAMLARHGYRIDTSMRARYDYRPDGGPDFTAVTPHAFRTGPDNALVELPLTTVFTGRARRAGTELYRRLGSVPRGRGLASRLGLLSRVALTPEDMPLDEALEAIRVAVGEGVRLLNFGFHSPSLEPGHTPYVRDAADLAAFWHWWDQVLTLLDRLGVTSASLAQILEAACGEPATSASAGGAGGL
ncbi:MAG: polysaccharide deacetylase family protein [Sphingomonas sp.]|nr:polysaccharide deacetylase family protein [Sphingomonas sp.]